MANEITRAPNYSNSTDHMITETYHVTNTTHRMTSHSTNSRDGMVTEEQNRKRGFKSTEKAEMLTNNDAKTTTFNDTTFKTEITTGEAIQPGLEQDSSSKEYSSSDVSVYNDFMTDSPEKVTDNSANGSTKYRDVIVTKSSTSYLKVLTSTVYSSDSSYKSNDGKIPLTTVDSLEDTSADKYSRPDTHTEPSRTTAVPSDNSFTKTMEHVDSTSSLVYNIFTTLKHTGTTDAMVRRTASPSKKLQKAMLLSPENLASDDMDPDKRPFAIAVGSFAIIFVVVFVICIFLMDVSTYIRDLKRMKKNVQSFFRYYQNFSKITP